MLATMRLGRLADQLVFPARALDDRALATDAHMHTTFTDGRSTVAEMLQAAATRGLSGMAFTEHVRRGCPWFGDFRAQVEADRRAQPRMRVWVGIEAKALDLEGGLDADPALIASADLVLGAFHNYPDGRGGFVKATSLSAREAAVLEFRALWALLDHPELDVLAHPGGLTRKHFGDFSEAFLTLLVRKAVSRGKAVELNGEYNTPAQFQRLLAECRRTGAWVTLGSNAHHASEVGRVSDMVRASAATLV